MKFHRKEAISVGIAIVIGLIFSGCASSEKPAPTATGVGSTHLWTPVNEWKSLAEADQNRPDNAASWGNATGIYLPIMREFSTSGLNPDALLFGYVAPPSTGYAERHRSYLPETHWSRVALRTSSRLSEELFAPKLPIQTYHTTHGSSSFQTGYSVYLISTRYTIDP